MHEADLIDCYPRLYHLTAAGAWPHIRRYGLEGTSALLDRFGVAGAGREAVESARRVEPVTLSDPAHGTAVVRDQLPMTDAALGKCLDGMSPREWYELLNGLVFFWPTAARLESLRDARLNRGRPHAVLTVDTAALLDRHGPAVRLCPINSGSTVRNPPRRGRHTFLPVADYPFADWRRRRGAAGAVAEVAVVGRVPDVEGVTVRADEFDGAGGCRVVWER